MRLHLQLILGHGRVYYLQTMEPKFGIIGFILSRTKLIINRISTVLKGLTYFQIHYLMVSKFMKGLGIPCFAHCFCGLFHNLVFIWLHMPSFYCRLLTQKSYGFQKVYTKVRKEAKKCITCRFNLRMKKK